MSNMNRHMKNVHVLQRGEIEIAPNIIVPDQPADPSNQSRNVNNTCLRPVLQRGEIEIAPNIIVPDQPAGPSNQPQNSNNTPNQHFDDDGYDDLCVEVLKHNEDAKLCDVTGGKRVHVVFYTSGHV